MPFRKVIFWAHLVAGVGAGVFILLMSVTGVLLTYEKNLVNLLRNSAEVSSAEGAGPLPIDRLADIAREKGRGGASLSLSKEKGKPVLVQQRGQEPLLLDPYSGELLVDPSHKLDAFFHSVTQLHRWLAMEGESRKTGRAITGASNLIFLFIVISGLYLWLPKIWRWSFVKLNLFFRRKLPNSKARDYNWHHVFGIWALVPLFFIVISGVVISYSWAGNLAYTLVGEDAPQRRGPPRAAAPENKNAPNDKPVILTSTLQDAYDVITAESDGKWTSARVSIPKKADAPIASITLNYGKGVVADYRDTYSYDLVASEITKVASSKEASRGRKLRTWLRFIHTGEQYGFIGQTIAGLSTLAACFLVYTGLALSFRRLIIPIFRRRRRKV
ncbi:putative iron-regulated membrane protein [Litorimonas taeanensis]|uniref:Putative iron-regulated membrane protein n=1 Tax=Litorimonas taeanensis TaxID=568099 RepID=A0A420WLV3_9PROT|nr:PepSY-associated TM helix domain-containing protein [Litorimonas taeanensis]RKQ72004.1 putative iron-regulated membrane protein [Litorimonas taeanensis]